MKYSYRTTPNIRLLDKRKAKGSAGSEIKSHNSVIFAVSTDLLGNFLKTDLEPKVAANLAEPVLRGSRMSSSQPTRAGQNHYRA